MKRRTNLFYTNDETNFLTFSNYGEHLTGVFLATNFKMFPSKFLCLNIPSLNGGKIINDKKETPENARKRFIKECLVAYYENKLAFLRDQIIEDNNKNIDKTNNVHPDSVLCYLGYLIDAIMQFDSDTKLVYYSPVTEQNYNGTFTDIIFTIDSGENFNKDYKITGASITDAIDKTNEIDDVRYIYGWHNGVEYLGPKNYEDVQPEFDEITSDNKGIYYRTSQHRIEINEIKDSLKYKDQIAFNVIIPLYDITLFDLTTNQTIISEPDLDEYTVLDETNKSEYLSMGSLNLNASYNGSEFVKNVPYGIWFANETITLKRHKGTNYAPSWSLLIGTQFKPFPNSDKLVQDNGGVSDMAGFATFAQILSRQHKLYDQLQTNAATLELTYNTITQNIEILKDMINQVDIPSREDMSYLTYNMSYLMNTLFNVNNSESINIHKWQVK